MSDKIFGRNPVLEALKGDRSINKLLIAKGATGGSLSEIRAKALAKRIPVQEVERPYLDNLAEGASHQGVVALGAARDYVEVEDILAIAGAKGEDPLVLLLDEVEDPRNLGSILRTADGAGAHGVIIPKRRSAGLTEAVAKASAGAVEYVPVARVSNIAQTIDNLKKQGLWIVGTDAQGDKVYWEQDLGGPLGIVVGSEGKGIGRLIKEKCDFLVRIPMKGKISSLNAGVATSLILYEVLRQRR
ncbi:MAG: 23S rRNA (guanosine(2251)-2'-O)-methyltransferase RlmB [Clostridia bacterium]|nr:23S rRNA (guanosine(2251)-2'-O)-methyltransferase RlmB [Clostridia bacterium]